MRSIIIAAALMITADADAYARGEWPDGPNKNWFETLRRPDVSESQGLPHKSLFCCSEGDVIRTRFKSRPTPIRTIPIRFENWYAWLDNNWTLIPHTKIVPGFAPDGRAYLFVHAKSILCFVRPKGGL